MSELRQKVEKNNTKSRGEFFRSKYAMSVGSRARVHEETQPQVVQREGQKNNFAARTHILVNETTWRRQHTARKKVKNHLPINYFLIDSSICSPFLVCVLRTSFLPSSDGSRATVESTRIKKKSQNQTRRENLQRVKKNRCGGVWLIFFSIDFSLLPLDPAREIFGRQFMKLRARFKWIHEPHRKERNKVARSDSNRHTKQLAILIHNLSTMPKWLWWRKKKEGRTIEADSGHSHLITSRTPLDGIMWGNVLWNHHHLIASLLRRVLRIVFKFNLTCLYLIISIVPALLVHFCYDRSCQ